MRKILLLALARTSSRWAPPPTSQPLWTTCRATSESLSSMASESVKMSSVEVLPTPEKPLTDKKNYRAIRLPNGLRALLISDTSYPLDKLAMEEEQEEADKGKEASADEEEEEGDSEEEDEDLEEEEESEEESEEEDEDDSPMAKKKSSSSGGLKKSAAALCVGAGSFSDPAVLPGLAHFVEHMVFMGSEKYPDENGFDNFIHNNGGSDNAHTDCETTNFYFDTQRKHFRQGLDRFAQFFVKPLMRVESMEREREAVDSEFEGALPSDSNRREQLFGTLAKDGHPMSKFMWGNLKSLKPDKMSMVDINKKLHEFKDRHYFAKNMTLAVQSQEELDTLEAWVKESFGNVPDGGGAERESFSHLKDPFDTEDFRQVYKVAPIQNVYQVDLNWALPPMLDKYRCKPLHYLSWIIGHEGKGSLISYLRKKVWALSLTAGNDGCGFEYNSTHSTFAITITLTKEGYQCLDKVLEATFGYLKMLRTSEPSERIFGEIRRIERLSFDFGEEAQPGDNVETLAENMQYYPPELYLSGDDLLFDFEPGLIRNCAEGLLPERANVLISAKEVKEHCSEVEPWFGTKYAKEPIPKEWMSQWQSALPEPDMHLPEENYFIAKDLSIKDSPVGVEGVLKYPVKLVEEQGGELFHRQDDVFLKPLAYMQFFICSSLPLDSLKDAVCLDIMASCIALVMVEETYPADLAQLSFALSPSERGFTLKLSGLNDKLKVLLETILNNINKLEEKLTEKEFMAVRDQIKRGYYNQFLKPLKLVREVRLSVIQDTFWQNTEKHAVISTLELKDLLDFSKRVVSNCYLQALVQGNITQSEAKECYNLVKAKLGIQSLRPGQAPVEHRCCELPRGEKVVRVDSLNTRDGNTAVTNYYQGTPGCLKQHAVLELANMIMEEPVFDVLRTQEQLGYIVFSMLRNTHGVLGFSVTISAQASKFSPDHVDCRIDKFLQWFLEEKLKSLSEEEFQDYVRTLVKEKKAADVTLYEEVSRNWSEIVNREYLFDRHFKDAENLENYVTKDKVCGEFKSMLRDGKNFRKLSVQVVGSSKNIVADANGEAEEAEAEEEEDKVYCVVCKAPEEATESGDHAKEGSSFISDIPGFKKSLTIHPVIHIVD